MAEDPVKKADETTKKENPKQQDPGAAENAGAKSAEGKRRKRPPKVVLLAVLVLVLGAGGFFAGQKLLGGKATLPKPPKEGAVVLLDEFVLNLAGGGTFIKCQIALGMSEKAPPKLIEDHNAAVRDMIVMTLTSKTFEEVSTPEGKLRLKQQLLTGLNRMLAEKTGRGPADNSHGDRSAGSVKRAEGRTRDGPGRGEGTGQGGAEGAPVEGPVLNIYFTAFATS